MKSVEGEGGNKRRGREVGSSGPHQPRRRLRFDSILPRIKLSPKPPPPFPLLPKNEKRLSFRSFHSLTQFRHGGKAFTQKPTLSSRDVKSTYVHHRPVTQFTQLKTLILESSCDFPLILINKKRISGTFSIIVHLSRKETRQKVRNWKTDLIPTEFLPVCNNLPCCSQFPKVRPRTQSASHS